MARILIIDDEPLVRHTLRLVLESDGHEVVEAENGDMGISADKAYPAELIITDLIMPGKEGIETILHFQRTRPDARIIAISGGGRLGSETPLRVAKRSGAIAVLRKPVGMNELIHSVRTCLSSAAQRPSNGDRRPSDHALRRQAPKFAMKPR